VQSHLKQAVAVNLTGYFNCARAAAKVMMAQRGGAMVNLSSGAGIRGSISAGVQYSASKAGIIGLPRNYPVSLDLFRVWERVSWKGLPPLESHC